jgi:hypothetical protein
LYKTFFQLLAIALLPLYSFSQVKLSGYVKTISNKPLENANILAIPNDSLNKLVFSTAKKNGSFLVTLKNNVTYNLTISFLGYKSFKKNIDVSNQDIKLSIILEEDVNELLEVEIKYKPPVIIKKDTTTYNVSAFTNGRERKLREILKKLPEVEVDKDGNVTANGKKITQVLVDNKIFFNGKSKLAVNNIPAEVVDEIEIIEDYHETAFMKGLEDSNDVAMNIGLKDDKKFFIFGNIEVGGGIKDRYLLHPTLFKYGPKATYNFIGDLNNTIQKSFAVSDYFDFEGGFNDENKNLYFDSNIIRFLRDTDFIKNKHKFAGFNSQFNPNEKLELRTFIIVLKDENRFQTNRTINYLEDDISESRSKISNNNSSIILGKTKLKITPNNKTVLNTEISIEDNNSDAFNKIDRIENNFDEVINYNNTKLDAKLKFEKQFSKAHTSKFITNYNYSNASNLNNWTSDTNLFFEELPIIEDFNYIIKQNETIKRNGFNWKFTHFWILNRKNHIYFSGGNTFQKNIVSQNDSQKLTDNTINNFEEFKNNLKNNYNRSFVSLQYKTFIWKVLTQLKLNYEHHYWKNQQLTTVSNNKSKLLPKVKLTYNIDDKKTIELTHFTKSYYPDFKKFIVSKKIVSFNSIFQGNTNLDLTFLRATRLSFRNFKTYGASYYFSIIYNERLNSVINNSIFNGIYSSISPVNNVFKNTNFNARFKWLYNKPYWRASTAFTFIKSKPYTLLNNKFTRANSDFYNYSIEGKTKFEDNPNLDIQLNYSHSINTTTAFKNILNKLNFNADLDYDLKSWKFVLSYNYTNYSNKFIAKTNSVFDNLSTSIFYNKIDSPFGLELRIHNLTNNKSKIESSFSQTIFDESITFVFPRTLLLIASYKL